MNVSKSFRITAMGKYLPAALSSDELEKKFHLTKGWSERYSGVVSRHRATHESNAFMGAKAIENALQKCGKEIGDIDLLISASATYDFPLPSQAAVIKNELKNGNKYDFPAWDIDSTCLSFLGALEMAAGMLDGKKYKTIAIVSSEIASKGLNPDNWETLTLFGDGAAAAIVEHDPQGASGYVKSEFKTYTDGVFDTMIKGGGNAYFFKENPYDRKMHSFAMNGKNLLRLAKKKCPEFFNAFFEDLKMSMNQCTHILPHQASKTGLMMFRDLFGIEEGKMQQNIETHGNCIAASIPILLHDAIENKKVQKGDLCLLTGTSAGFTIGAMLLKF